MTTKERRALSEHQRTLAKLQKIQQGHALIELKSAINRANLCALFDTLAIYTHPDNINAFCDAVDDLIQAEFGNIIEPDTNMHEARVEDVTAFIERNIDRAMTAQEKQAIDRVDEQTLHLLAAAIIEKREA